MRRFLVPLFILMLIAGSYTEPGRQAGRLLGGWFSFLGTGGGDQRQAAHKPAPASHPAPSPPAVRDDGRLIDPAPSSGGPLKYVTDMVAAFGAWALGESARSPKTAPEKFAGNRRAVAADDHQPEAGKLELRGVGFRPAAGPASAADHPTGAAAPTPLCLLCTESDPQGVIFPPC